MSEDTERIYEVHDEVARNAQAFADAAAGPLPGSASNASGSITVNLDEEGLLTVAITDSWASDYQPAELAGGVIQTFQDLAAARTAGWATNLASALDEERPNKPIPPASETTAGKLKAAFDGDADGAAEMATVLENLLGFLEDVSANFDTSFDQAVKRGSASHNSRPESGHLSVSVNAAGDLLSLEFSENWVSRATGSQISRELNEAIARAKADGTTGGAGPLDGTPLGKYQKYVDDPDSFIQFMRGRE